MPLDLTVFESTRVIAYGSVAIWSVTKHRLHKRTRCQIVSYMIALRRWCTCSHAFTRPMQHRTGIDTNKHRKPGSWRIEVNRGCMLLGLKNRLGSYRLMQRCVWFDRPQYPESSWPRRILTPAFASASSMASKWSVLTATKTLRAEQASTLSKEYDDEKDWWNVGVSLFCGFDYSMRLMFSKFWWT